jgi:predicted ATP-dependent serine protease
MDRTKKNRKIYCCSECGAEVVDEDKFCPSCGIEFEDLIKENRDNEPIVIRDFQDMLDAELAMEQLNEQNIYSFISKDDIAVLGILRSAHLMVRRADEEKALEILNAMGW